MLLIRNRTSSRPRSALSLSLAFALVAGVFMAAPVSAATKTAVIETIAPTVGTTGTVVTITGTDLTATTAVHFGTTAATSFAYSSATKVTAVAPAGTGTVDVKVTNANGNVIAKSAFTYKASLTPSISSVTPVAGFPSGYNEITLVGANYVGTTAVKFGTVNAVNFKVNSDTSISAVVPPAASGTVVNVYVTNGAGTSTSAATYTYQNIACLSQTYVTTKFAKGISKLKPLQIAELKTAATQFKTLGCTSVNLVRYNETIKTSMSASHKAYIKLQRERALAVYNVLVNRTRNIGGTTVFKLVKFTNQISQAKRAYDVRADYRKISLVVPGVNAIDAIYPNAGPLSGGNTINITGRGFENIATAGAVRFGGVSATYTLNAAKDTLSVVVPMVAAAGTVVVTVQPSTSAPALSTSYTYAGTPTISSISASSGPLAGSNTLTITGSGFVGMRSVSAVKFGTLNAASYTVTSATSISAVVPAGLAAGSVNISVVTPTGTSNTQTYLYIGAPNISRVSPSNIALAGGNLIIQGEEFVGVTASAIRFSNGSDTWNPVSITTSGDSSITATLGSKSSTYAGAIDVTVTTGGGSVTLNDAFVFGMAITAVAKTGGGAAEGPIAGGTNITITGVDFPATITKVTVGGVNATSVNRASSGTSITAVTPSRDYTGKVAVRVYSSDTVYAELVDAFSYIPTIDSVTPNAGPLENGENLTIVGTGFNGIKNSSLKVSIGGEDAFIVSVDADDEVMVITPPTGTAGIKNVVVTSNDVKATKNAAYTYWGTPNISVITPVNVGGGSVTITGSNFIDGETTVRLSNGSATDVTVNSATSITFTAPAHAAGNVTVTVETPGSGSDNGSLTYRANSTISAISDVSTLGGSVTITGTNFVAGASTVSLGEGSATGVTVNSATSITFTAPAHAAGGITVTVTTVAGGSATGTLTYVAP